MDLLVPLFALMLGFGYRVARGDLPNPTWRHLLRPSRIATWTCITWRGFSRNPLSGPR